MQATRATVTGVVLCFLVGVKGTKVDRDQLSVARANNDFGHRLYQELKGNSGNLFFSPFSAHAVLSMAYAGARGATARELADGISLNPQSLAQVEAGYQALMKNIKKSNGSVIVDIANKVYTSVKIKPAYRTAAVKKFLSGVQQVNFKQDPEGARNSINQWVEGKTRNKIKNLLPAGSVHIFTQMLLVNALYFKGDWLNSFKSYKTKVEKFKLNSKYSKTVEMMSMNEKDFPYAEYDDYQVLRMNYLGGDFSMVILLPKEIDGVAELEASLPTLDWGDIDRKLSTVNRVDVHIPKFKVERQIDLKESLKKLGIRLAFGDDADFSGITDKDIYASTVVQKAFIEVTEQGTEASAATGGVFSLPLSYIRYLGPPPPVFRADHPFIFLLRHEPSRAVLFFGRFSGPEEST